MSRVLVFLLVVVLVVVLAIGLVRFYFLEKMAKQEEQEEECLYRMLKEDRCPRCGPTHFEIEVLDQYSQRFRMQCCMCSEMFIFIGSVHSAKRLNRAG